MECFKPSLSLTLKEIKLIMKFEKVKWLNNHEIDISLFGPKLAVLKIEHEIFFDWEIENQAV